MEYELRADPEYHFDDLSNGQVFIFKDDISRYGAPQVYMRLAGNEYRLLIGSQHYSHHRNLGVKIATPCSLTYTL